MKKAPAPSIESKTPAKKRTRKENLDELFSVFNTKDTVLITIDPDPDAVGSALALKRLLWHKVQSVTIGMIRPMRRLNNITMVRLLNLPLVLLDKNQLQPFDKYAVVDGQPTHNEFFRNFHYDAVIDHHPLEDGKIDAPFVDIRPEYGSTATMLTEYLREAKIKPSQSLSTTLLYGIKTDTRNFERHTIVDDIAAFRYLFPLANRNVLRKIEISDLTLRDLKFFQEAVEHKQIIKDRIFSHLNEVPNSDILVLIAEFFLKIHDISWSVISGIYEDTLIVVIRNGGARKDAGKIVRQALGDMGCAGGHQTMARAEIPLSKLKKELSEVSASSIEQFLQKALSP